MIIAFQLNVSLSRGRKFCKFLINLIKVSLNNPDLKRHLNIRLKYLQQNGVLGKTISIDNIVEAICNSITFSIRGRNYTIYIDRKRIFSNSLFTVFEIAQLLNFGNNECIGSYVISKLFRQYEQNVNKYYMLFLFRK